MFRFASALLNQLLNQAANPDKDFFPTAVRAQGLLDIYVICY